ncbi:hypothetical protein LINPERPRIM_LOCUS8251 [Linum perenne]
MASVVLLRVFISLWLDLFSFEYYLSLVATVFLAPLLTRAIFGQALAIKTCNKVCQWVKDVENEIFLMGASPFSW